MVQNRFAFILSVFGLVIALYLWNMHSHPQDIPCGLHSTGCADVARSPYSRFPVGTGLPVAAYGAVAYLGLAGLAFLRTMTESARVSRLLLGLGLALASAGLVASLSLTYLELFVIHAICKWCMMSQAVIALIFLLHLTEWLKPARPAPSAAR